MGFKVHVHRHWQLIDCHIFYFCHALYFSPWKRVVFHSMKSFKFTTVTRKWYEWEAEFVVRQTRILAYMLLLWVKTMGHSLGNLDAKSPLTTSYADYVYFNYNLTWHRIVCSLCRDIDVIGNNCFHMLVNGGLLRPVLARHAIWALTYVLCEILHVMMIIDIK